MTHPSASPRTAVGPASNERVHGTVHGGPTWRYSAWLSGMAVATAMYFTSLALAVDSRAVLVVSLAFATCVAGLSMGLLSGARRSGTGPPRRWTASVGVWGALFAVALVLGMAILPAGLVFWWPAAAVCAAPLILGVRTATRS